MKISARQLKGAKVYVCGEQEPFGEFSDILLDEYGKIVGYIVKTISIVPISKIIRICDVENIADGKIFLSKTAYIENAEHFKSRTGQHSIYSNGLKLAVNIDKRPQKLKDIRFNLETSEICDVVVLKNIIAGKNEISVNKIYAKDNTIYIEK